MKLKELESYLSGCDQFENPKIILEQYATSPHIAACMINAAQQHLQDGLVCELGSGCGILSIGSILVGASYVIGLEVDPEAISIAIRNRDEILEEASNLDFIQTEINWNDTESPQTEMQQPHVLRNRFHQFFDVVIMNPPFGTKNNAGADYGFLKYATNLVKPGGYIYTLHKTSTRSFFEKKKLQNSLNLNGRVLAQVKFDLPHSYKFHKSNSVDVHVDFWEFRKN